jgi:hypothetical protein
MTFSTFAIGVAAGFFAARLLDPGVARDTGGGRRVGARRSASRRDDRYTGAHAAGPDRPNVAERMRDDRRTGSPVAGDSALADSVREGNLFASASQRGETPVTPGLPDFARGA